MLVEIGNSLILFVDVAETNSKFGNEKTMRGLQLKPDGGSESCMQQVDRRKDTK